VQFDSLHAAEEGIEQADGVWQRSLATEDEDGLRKSLQRYETILGAPPLTLDPPASGDSHQFESQFASLVSSVFTWLARPLRLRSLHRVAAARELLRDDKQMIPMIAHAHRQLLAENYCIEMLDEAMAQMDYGQQMGKKQYQKCIAPIARGTILFAPTEVEADAAFAKALLLNGPFDGDESILTWTSRWQLPDHHIPGLKAMPWWMDHPAIAVLEAKFEMLAAEFLEALQWEAQFREVLSSTGQLDKEANAATGFTRRRADAWIPKPKNGWGMLPLIVNGKEEGSKRCISPGTCALVRQLRNETDNKQGSDRGDGNGDLSGVGYYMLKPGTHLQVHAGPTNTRLTCHLTLQGGEGGWFTVGAAKPRQWERGKAFCFDDSFVHHATHSGSEDRYVLLMDIPHPGLPHNGGGGSKQGNKQPHGQIPF
jgi:aspartate beta-hydroxylase